MQIKITRLSQFDGLELKEATFKNHVFPEHFHDAYSIGILEQGIEQLSFVSKQVVVHAHSVIIINPYDIHANSYFDNDSWKYRIVYINPDVMQHFQRRSGLFSGKKVWFSKSLIDDIILYTLLLDFHSKKAVDKATSLHQVLHHLLSHHAGILPEDDECKEAGAITDIKMYMERHLYGKLVLSELAAKCHMDKYSFLRLFKKQVGLTPGSYTLLQRINKAKQLIATGASITDVALETGFYDQSHFTHYFNKYIGISPLNYKKGIITE